ncbi:hypothetical protein M2347_004090 [Chryseobacterium sp. H1D6B]|uniref:hypothetical protein n=1 Tax=Chryseobacterium sp. H1D6B TaxID=2940588 RepID=UPI0015CE6313|nr:hypothetical protein [Chryseobacterium sp. H1D6B]MDH6254363.1 hypothetical protein [Chryseobacterium sp. H1D6B]
MKNLLSVNKLNREKLKQIQGAADVRYCCIKFCDTLQCTLWVSNWRFCALGENPECIQN